jgi:uncharacterized protein YceK
MKISLTALALAFFLGGCGTIVDMATEQHIYGGVQNDARMIGHPYRQNNEQEDYFFPLVLFGILDMPLSFAADTVLLPVTITIVLTRPEDPTSPSSRPQR